MNFGSIATGTSLRVLLKMFSAHFLTFPRRQITKQNALLRTVDVAWSADSQLLRAVEASGFGSCEEPRTLHGPARPFRPGAPQSPSPPHGQPGGRQSEQDLSCYFTDRPSSGTFSCGKHFPLTSITTLTVGLTVFMEILSLSLTLSDCSCSHASSHPLIHVIVKWGGAWLETKLVLDTPWAHGKALLAAGTACIRTALRRHGRDLGEGGRPRGRPGSLPHCCWLARLSSLFCCGTQMPHSCETK